MPVEHPDFQAFFQSAPGLYLVLDPTFRILAVSDAYLAATMTRRPEILGRGIFEVFPDNPDDPGATGVSNLRASLERVRDARVADAMAVQKYDVRRPADEGSAFEERFWSPLNSPVLDGQGRLRYIIHRVEDVTEFVRLKQQGAEQSRRSAELRDRAERSEAEVFLRAQQVQEANRQLTEANAELSRLYAQTRELDQLKTQFFANVSHELRTPLTLILGPLHKHVGSPDCPRALRGDLEVVERNARLLLTRVNDLLDLSKLEAGRMHVEYAEVDLARLSRQVAAHFESLAAERDIRYGCEAPERLPAHVDAEKIQRILFNLLSNALKFTPPAGSVRLTVRDDSDRAILEVQDTGPGVPDHLREGVFERFRQVDGHANHRHRGTGLGLSIVKEFVELHSGTVELREAPGGGALVVVSLPMRAPPGATVAVAGSRLDERSPPNFDELGPDLEHAPRRGRPEPDIVRSPDAEDAALLLIVEDNPDMRAFLCDALGSQYRIVTAIDGQDGLEKAVALRPDLILSDMMMPRMSGEEMVAQLRRRAELDDLPVIFLTAKVDDALRVRALRDGAQDFVSKPFSVPELLARIERRVADRRRSQERLRQAHKLESVGRLASGVAHDFNNLLTAIIAYASLMTDGAAPAASQVECARGILSASERAAGLTRQLLAFARKQTVAPTVFDLSALVRNAEPLLRRLLREDIEIVLKLDAKTATTRADPGQIEQVLVNLAVNARDAMPGPGRLTLQTLNRSLELQPGTKPGECVALVVSDTGVGMDEHVRTRLFEPFFTTKEVGRGTGLGLASSYGIVQQAGGRIDVHSELGRGTSFEVYLPLANEPCAAPASPTRSAPAVRGAGTILLAEDDPLVRSVLVKALRTSGYSVLEAGDGRQALDLADQHRGRFDLLVSDALMPQLNGRDLAARLRQSQPNLQVLFISGYSEEVYGYDEAPEPGVSFLPKPFTPQALNDRVRQLLG